MLHNPRRPPLLSVLGRGHSFARTKPGTRAPPRLLHMYYVRLCSKKLLSDIARARTLFVLLPRSCRLSFAVLLLRSRVLPLPLQGTLPESLCTWPLFLESLAATRDASSELETIPSPPLSLPFFSSILSRPPSFYSLDTPSREEKNDRDAACRSSI